MITRIDIIDTLPTRISFLVINRTLLVRIIFQVCYNILNGFYSL
nr:MAG TPA: hypothetical protein [Caudoviricetes sp.]